MTGIRSVIVQDREAGEEITADEHRERFVVKMSGILSHQYSLTCVLHK